MWHNLRKTSAHIHLEYGYSTTNHLFADSIKASINSVAIVSFDLNCNLRTLNKEEFAYIDARGLADGEIEQLSSLQCDDNHLLKRLRNILNNSELTPDRWQLVIQLDGEHAFDVDVVYSKEHEYSSLVFRVNG